MPNSDEATQILITDWFRRVRESQYIHYECGSIFARRHLFLGIPAVALSAFVGTAVFASIANGANDWVAILVGMISVIAAVLTSLQTFLGYSERAQLHRAAGAKYGGLRRRLEMLKTFTPNTGEELQNRISEIRDSMDALAEEAPAVPSRLKRRLDQDIKRRGHHRIFSIPSGDGSTT